MTAREHPSLHVAYLVSEYPKLSHTFVSTEIAGLRRLGARVDTFSVREPTPADLLTAGNRDERDRTTYLIRDVRTRLPALLALILRRPDVAVVGALEALRFCAGAAHGKRLFYLLEALALMRSMAARDVRHVHVHLANNAADVAHLAVTMGHRFDRRRWTWSLAVHGPNELADVAGYNLARKAASAAFVACITDYCRSQVMALVPESQWASLHVVGMGIDPQAFDLADRSGRADRPVRLLFVGRLVAEKAPLLLLEAVSRLDPGSVQVRIVGAGPLAGDLARSVAVRGLTDTVVLTGPLGQDQLPDQYRWADAFCLPSFAEGLPVVIMEAMATGLPVVTTWVAGIPELVTDGATGRLVPPGNVVALTDALRGISALARRPDVAARARDDVVRTHDTAHTVAALATLLAATTGGV